MRNLISSAISYMLSLVTVFWCFLTYMKAPEMVWYTAGAMVFGFLVTFCLTDMTMRALDAIRNKEDDDESV